MLGPHTEILPLFVESKERVTEKSGTIILRIQGLVTLVVQK